MNDPCLHSWEFTASPVALCLMLFFSVLNKADEVYRKFQQIHLFPEMLHLEPKYQVGDTGFKLQPENCLPSALSGILQCILPHPPGSLISICDIPLNMTHCAVNAAL